MGNEAKSEKLNKIRESNRKHQRKCKGKTKSESSSKFRESKNSCHGKLKWKDNAKSQNTQYFNNAEKKKKSVILNDALMKDITNESSCNKKDEVLMEQQGQMKDPAFPGKKFSQCIIKTSSAEKIVKKSNIRINIR